MPSSSSVNVICKLLLTESDPVTSLGLSGWREEQDKDTDVTRGLPPVTSQVKVRSSVEYSGCDEGLRVMTGACGGGSVDNQNSGDVIYLTTNIINVNIWQTSSQLLHTMGGEDSLVVERCTPDRKVAGSSRGRSGGRNFFSLQFNSIQFKNFNHPTRGNFVVVMAGS